MNNTQFNFNPKPSRNIIWDKVQKRFRDIDEIDFARKEVVPHDGSDVIPFAECTFCQSTNLLDKNGKEIFEGAILEDSNEDILVVKYEYGCFKGCILNGPKFPLRAHWFVNKYNVPKVIGHICSNPEMLEEK